MQQLIREYLQENLVNIMVDVVEQHRTHQINCRGSAKNSTRTVEKNACVVLIVIYQLFEKLNNEKQYHKIQLKYFYSRNDVGFANTLATVNPFGEGCCKTLLSYNIDKYLKLSGLEPLIVTPENQFFFFSLENEQT